MLPCMTFTHISLSYSVKLLDHCAHTPPLCRMNEMSGCLVFVLPVLDQSVRSKRSRITRSLDVGAGAAPLSPHLVSFLPALTLCSLYSGAALSAFIPLSLSLSKFLSSSLVSLLVSPRITSFSLTFSYHLSPPPPLLFSPYPLLVWKGS